MASIALSNLHGTDLPGDVLARPSAPTRLSGASPSRQWRGSAIRVFERDPELLDGLDPEEAAAARALTLVPTLQLDRGSWTPPSPAHCERMVGLLVLDGLLTRCDKVNGKVCPELVGPGDLLRPWDDDGERMGIDVSTSWPVLEPVTLAVLGPRFVEALRRWPWISKNLMARQVQRSRMTALRMAIAQTRRADDRLRLLFCGLADRWGRVTPDGVLVALPLSNQLIAQLVCLRRPAVSSTMGRLAESGEIVRRPGVGFMLDMAVGSPDAGWGTVLALQQALGPRVSAASAARSSIAWVST